MKLRWLRCCRNKGRGWTQKTSTLQPVSSPAMSHLFPSAQETLAPSGKLVFPYLQTAESHLTTPHGNQMHWPWELHCSLGSQNVPNFRDIIPQLTCTNQSTIILPKPHIQDTFYLWGGDRCTLGHTWQCSRFSLGSVHRSQFIFINNIFIEVPWLQTCL